MSYVIKEVKPRSTRYTYRFSVPSSPLVPKAPVRFSERKPSRGSLEPVSDRSCCESVIQPSSQRDIPDSWHRDRSYVSCTPPAKASAYGRTQSAPKYSPSRQSRYSRPKAFEDTAPAYDVYDDLDDIRAQGGDGRIGQWTWDPVGKAYYRDSTFWMRADDFNTNASRRDRMTDDGDGITWTTSTNAMSNEPATLVEWSAYHNRDVYVGNNGSRRIQGESRHYRGTDEARRPEIAESYKKYTPPLHKSSRPSRERRWFGF